MTTQPSTIHDVLDVLDEDGDLDDNLPRERWANTPEQDTCETTIGGRSPMKANAMELGVYEVLGLPYPGEEDFDEERKVVSLAQMDACGKETRSAFMKMTNGQGGISLGNDNNGQPTADEVICFHNLSILCAHKGLAIPTFIEFKAMRAEEKLEEEKAARDARTINLGQGDKNFATAGDRYPVMALDEKPNPFALLDERTLGFVGEHKLVTQPDLDTLRDPNTAGYIGDHQLPAPPKFAKIIGGLGANSQFIGAASRRHSRGAPRQKALNCG